MVFHFFRATFTTPADPARADLTKLQNQLNVYLAVEAGVRVRAQYSPNFTPPV